MRVRVRNTLSPRRRRTFVIPVLDFSPASPLNIRTLLQDLEAIEGQVVVVFNDPAVARELARHPRLTRSASMSQNVGVSRAWNVGIELADTPHVFVLNADLALAPGAVDEIEEGLATLDRAACVGPEGSLLDAFAARDFVHFQRGDITAATEVDAVSGFLFAVKREHFGPGGFRFETAFTPCFFEEWDLGLQIKRAGLKSWVVPTTAYTHSGSGSIAAREKIPFLGRSATPERLLAQNRRRFLAKWRAIARRDGSGAAWLESQIGRYARQLALSLLRARDVARAAHALAHLASTAGTRPDLHALAGYALACHGRHREALASYRKASRLDRGLDLSRFIAGLTAELEHGLESSP